MVKLVGIDPEFALIVMPFFDKSVDPENSFEKHVRKVRKKNLRADLHSALKVARMDIVAWCIRTQHFEERTILYHLQHTDYLIGCQLQVTPGDFNLRMMANTIQASAVRKDFAIYAAEMSLPNIAKVIEKALAVRPTSLLAKESAARKQAVIVKLQDGYTIP